MNRSSSPPILIIEDDEDDTLHETNVRSSSISEMNLPRKKRRLSNTNLTMNSLAMNHSKRQRTFMDSDMILLDPNDYIMERPDAHAYRSFDWTIQPSRSLIPTVLNGNNLAKQRSIDRPNNQATRKITPLPLPLPTQTSTINRPSIQRGRPLKNSRIPTIPPRLQSSSSQPIFATKQLTPRVPLSSTLSTPNLTSDARRQILNGTGLFSAFHDSKYYRCNICKFKSATSSTLLQHLFTHMFFCDHCSFYTYSYYNLSQHLFDKHHINLPDDVTQVNNPKSFDLLYVTRCQDGTFALCMDSSTKQITNDQQRTIISSANPNEQLQNQSPKKKFLQSTEHSKTKPTLILMQQRNDPSLKQASYLHSFTLEYNICRQQTIGQLSQKKNRSKRVLSPIRLIDEIALCLKSIVNQIIEHEEKQSCQPSSLICALPHAVLQSVFLDENILQILNLKTKFDINTSNRFTNDNLEQRFILSSSNGNQNEQTILSALHSSMTNGESIYTQTRAEKLPIVHDNSHRFFNKNSKTIPIRPIAPKMTRPSVDKNNNSVLLPKASSIPNVIVLD